MEAQPGLVLIECWEFLPTSQTLPNTSEGELLSKGSSGIPDAGQCVYRCHADQWVGQDLEGLRTMFVGLHPQVMAKLESSGFSPLGFPRTHPLVPSAGVPRDL